MSLLLNWAPNLHPLVVHFPIVLLIAAASVDVVDAFFQRPAWLSTVATSLYLAGAGAAIAAYLTGAQAGSTVFLPGMAHPVLSGHRWWALLTTWYFGIVAVARVSAGLAGVPRTRSHRVWLLVAGLVGVVLLQQAADRGAQLVYRHGVGVIAAPGSR